jgi:hypothetical protein
MNEQDVIQDPVDGSVDLTQELYDKIEKQLKVYQFTFIKFPDGSNITSSGLVGKFNDHVGKKDGTIVVRFDLIYRPNKDTNPTIPNDLISGGVISIMNRLLNWIPELLSYPKEVLDAITFEIYSVKISYNEGFFDLYNLWILDTAVMNKLSGNYKLTDLIDNPSEVTSLYYMERPPTFDKDYSMMMKRGEKKMRVTYQALRKGTWRGHTYEYEGRPHYMVYQDYNNYNKSDGIIQPEFRYGITPSPRHPKIDGKHWSETFDSDTMAEFVKYIEERFNLMGIRFD